MSRGINGVSNEIRLRSLVISEERLRRRIGRGFSLPNRLSWSERR
jgi:hypothetical protein